MADTNVDIILGMSFETFSNSDIVFANRELTWRFYTIDETLSTTWRVEFIDKQEFTKAELDEDVETFLIYISSLSLKLMTIYPAQEAQIVLLLIEKITVSAKYSDFGEVFLEESAAKLL